jgi:GPH family glycoside/pentoside/hexuronide:cation symporter
MKQSAPPVASSDKVPLKEKLAYSIGQVGGLADAMENGLLRPVFVVTMGISPALLSTLDAIYRLWNAVTDLFMGWLSDNTRTRWGRRRPYMFIGAILAALWMPTIWLFDRSWELHWIIVWLVVFQLGITLFVAIWNVPYQCLLLEISPSTAERTNVSAWRAYFGKAVGFIAGWVWYLSQLPVFHDASGKPDIIKGALWVTLGGAVIAVSCALLPAIFCRERYYHQAQKQVKLPIRTSIKLTFKNPVFVRLISFTALFAIGTGATESLSFFVRLYYVCGGDMKLAAAISGIGSTITLFTGIAAIPLCQWSVHRFGTRTTMLAIMATLFFTGVSTLVTLTPAYPYLSLVNGIFSSIAVTAIWVLIPTMNGDIADHDELRTNERREGAFASTFSWTLKFSLSVALAISGVLVELAGFNAKLATAQPPEVLLAMRLLLAFVPAVLLGAAFWVTWRYPLTTPRMTEIRAELEARRGKL